MPHATRREFLLQSGAGALALGAAATARAEAPRPREFKISLAGWSFHKLVGRSPKQKPMTELPRIAREDCGIEAIELVNQMIGSQEKSFLDQIAKEAEKHQVKILLMMVDNEGMIGAEKEDARAHAVERHKFWIDVIADYGGHSMRMNWLGAPEDAWKDPAALKAFVDRSVPGLHALCEHGEKKKINVIIENHGGCSSRPRALEQLVKAVKHPRFGTLPDFGNFPKEVDVYEAIDILMNYAIAAVSAKCNDFDDAIGLETRLDYPRLIANVCDKHGYKGYIGIEYEGGRLPELEGVKRCKALLEKLRTA